MPISSDSLFHFTNKLDHLFNILTNNFRPHYCLEDFNNVLAPEDTYFPELEFAIPMVCFCDIPLSNAAQHMEVYGYYGIGLTKKWGKINGITPVLYTYRGSAMANTLRALLIRINSEDVASPLSDDLQADFFDIACYIKPYEGSLLRSGRSIDSVRFYDEREWRYVSTSVHGDRRYLTKEAFGNDNSREKASQEVFDQERIEFTPSDVKYVIVSDEQEILPLIRKIEKVKGRLSHDQVKILTSRIITAQQVRCDF